MVAERSAVRGDPALRSVVEDVHRGGGGARHEGGEAREGGQRGIPGAVEHAEAADRVEAAAVGCAVGGHRPM